jgi:flagellar hook-associated protein 1 FlgK
MPISSFMGLQTSLRGLLAHQQAIDTTSHNVANANTEGYSRQEATLAATDAMKVVGTGNGSIGSLGTGVTVQQYTRIRDAFLDLQYRAQNMQVGDQQTRSTQLDQVELSLSEPGDNGIASALDSFKAAWQDLANNPGDGAARTQVLARAQTLRDTITTQSTAVQNEWSTQRTSLDNGAAEVNQVASQLAGLNKALQSAYVAGTDANTLLDQRDQLTMRLSELTGATVTLNSDTTADVSVAGLSLVSGMTASTMSTSGATDLTGQDSDPVQLMIDGNAVTLGTGELGAAQRLIGTDLPGYRDSLDSFVASLASSVNAQHASGLDLSGAPGGDLFSGSTAATLQVAITDPSLVAVADPLKGGLDNTNALTMAGLDMGASSYRDLITSFGVSVSSAKQGSTNQATLVDQIDASRESVSGVNQDEEMVNLLAAQRGYEGASRVLTTMDEMLDTLINKTGLVGR